MGILCTGNSRVGVTTVASAYIRESSFPIINICIYTNMQEIIQGGVYTELN